MPTKTFHCENCDIKVKKILKYNDKSILVCDKCKQKMEIVLDVIPECKITETPDRYRGKTLRKNFKKMMKKRTKEHFDKEEKDRLIQEHGIEEAKQQGWVDKKGKKKKLIDLK